MAPPIGPYYHHHHPLTYFFWVPTKFYSRLAVEKNLAEKSRRSIVALVLLLRHTRLLLSRYNIDIYIRWTDCKSCDGSVAQSQTPSTYLYAAPKRPPKNLPK